MFLFKNMLGDTDSHSSMTVSRSSDTLECVLTCDSPNKVKITQQLKRYTRFIQKKIMFEKQEKGESITKALTPENFPDYFYSVFENKTSSFLEVGSSKYEIKIIGTLDALKSAVEALVFADFYNKESCSLPPLLVEYAEQLSSGDTPSVITKIDFNF